MYNTIVLPGGGVKGFYILGGIQAAMDRGLLDNVINYVGTSIGAIICYLLSIGYTPIEIIVALQLGKWLEHIKPFNLTGMIDWSGALSFTPIQEALEKMTIDKIGKLLTLGKLKEEFKKTLICTTFNVTRYETEYLGPNNYPDLPCLTALRMSSSIPLIFERYKYMNNYYIDGGVADNLPLKKGEELSGLSKVFAIHLENREAIDDSIISYFLKILQIPINNFVNESIKNKGERTDVYPIENKAINIVNFHIKSRERLEFFSKGYSDVITEIKRKEEIIVDIADILIGNVVTEESKIVIDTELKIENTKESEEKEEKENGIESDIERNERKERKEGKENCKTEEDRKDGKDGKENRTDSSGSTEIQTGETCGSGV